MAMLKRTDSKTMKESVPPPRSCIACTDTDVQLIRPCRTCETDYCVDCVQSMFVAATTDQASMPPHCCALLQIHTVISHLTMEQATAYREKFEEWITPVKTYCPSPTCSAFIPERRLPAPTDAGPSGQSLDSVLKEILGKLTLYSCSRFFRGEPDITQLPGYTVVVQHPMHLGMIQERLEASSYSTTSDFTKDVRLIITNAREYNGTTHPVTKAAEELWNRYLNEISNTTDRLVKVNANAVASPFFPCPSCHIAICTSCKKVEHTGKLCDTTAEDHELAMLATFGYKRCPRCKAGVKKMFGCSHMQCLCGAHFCYWCQRGLNDCDGSCDERQTESDEEDYESEEDGDGHDEEGNGNDEVPQAVQTVAPPAPVAQQQTRPSAQADQATASNAIVNLDAGGSRRWGDGGYDFGEEPEDEGFYQVWSCNHNFETYRVRADDGFDRGDLNKLECNRCFTKVVPMRMQPQVPNKKRRKVPFRPKGAAFPVVEEDVALATTEEEEAWECLRCRVVVCLGCRDKYKTAQEE